MAKVPETTAPLLPQEVANAEHDTDGFKRVRDLEANGTPKKVAVSDSLGQPAVTDLLQEILAELKAMRLSQDVTYEKEGL